MNRTRLIQLAARVSRYLGPLCPHGFGALCLPGRVQASNNRTPFDGAARGEESNATAVTGSPIVVSATNHPATTLPPAPVAAVGVGADSVFQMVPIRNPATGKTSNQFN